MVYSRQTPKGQQMKKLSIIAEKLNICQVSGWNEKWGSEIRQEFAVKPRLVAPVPPVSLHPQAEWCPWPLYLQFCIWAQSHIWARVIHCISGFDYRTFMGSTTYFSSNSIRSHCCGAAPASDTASCSCRRGGWAADLTKLKDSGIAIPFRVVHKAFGQNLPAFIARDTGEAKEGLLSLAAPRHYLTCPYALKQHLPYPCIFPNQCLSKTFF